MCEPSHDPHIILYRKRIFDKNFSLATIPQQFHNSLATIPRQHHEKKLEKRHLSAIWFFSFGHRFGLWFGWLGLFIRRWRWHKPVDIVEKIIDSLTKIGSGSLGRSVFGLGRLWRSLGFCLHRCFIISQGQFLNWSFLRFLHFSHNLIGRNRG